MENQQAYFTGQYLLALPGMEDPRFAQSVIAVCTHDADGAIGVGIGHLLADMTVGALFDQLDIKGSHGRDAPVHFGGPVDPQRGFVLHSRDWSGQDSVDVAGLWGLSNTLDVLRAIAGGTGPSRWIVSLGYAGWSGGQLETEMQHNAWHLVPVDTERMMSTDTAERWAMAYAQGGVDVRMLSAHAGSA